MKEAENKIIEIKEDIKIGDIILETGNILIALDRIL